MIISIHNNGFLIELNYSINFIFVILIYFGKNVWKIIIFSSIRFVKKWNQFTFYYDYRVVCLLNILE